MEGDRCGGEGEEELGYVEDDRFDAVSLLAAESFNARLHVLVEFRLHLQTKTNDLYAQKQHERIERRS